MRNKSLWSLKISCKRCCCNRKAVRTCSVVWPVFPRTDRLCWWDSAGHTKTSLHCGGTRRREVWLLLQLLWWLLLLFYVRMTLVVQTNCHIGQLLSALGISEPVLACLYYNSQFTSHSQSLPSLPLKTAYIQSTSQQGVPQVCFLLHEKIKQTISFGLF